MEVSTEVVQSLRVLGLPSDATADDVRSAFRRLARAYHPDVAGKHYARKFEQITKAYALLKDSPLTETPRADDGAGSGFSRPSQVSKNAPNDTGRRFSFSSVFSRPFLWYRKKRSEHAACEKTERAERERTRRAAEDARKKSLLEREARIEAILARGERLIDGFIDRMEREALDVGIQGLALRLTSDVCPVRHLALARLGELANNQEIFNAILGALQKWDIDEKSARLVAALPLKPENHRRLALGLAVKANVMPDSLMSHLLQLYNPRVADRELWESYLSHAGARGVALIMRRWPGKTFVSEPLLCRLIARDDESVLITTLSAMKQRSVPCPVAGRERLSAHLSHPNLAVRVWAKALLNTA